MLGSLIRSATQLLILHSVLVFVDNLFCHKTHRWIATNSPFWFLEVAIATSAHATCGETVMKSAGHVGVLLTSVDEKQQRIKGKQRSPEQVMMGLEPNTAHLHSDTDIT